MYLFQIILCRIMTKFTKIVDIFSNDIFSVPAQVELNSAEVSQKLQHVTWQSEGQLRAQAFVEILIQSQYD